MSLLTSRARRLAAATAVAAAVAGGSMAASAATSKPSATTFSLFPNAAQLNCLAAPGSVPTATVKVQRGDLNDRLTLKVKGLKPNLDFDVFTVENTPQLSNGTPNPDFHGSFGFAWYQSDLQTNRHGEGEVSLKTILLDQIFGFDSSRGVTPVNTFNLGFWFNNPADAAGCGFTGTTPFNGEHTAGPLAMISRQDVATKLGPLCTSPESDSTGAFHCNP